MIGGEEGAGSVLSTRQRELLEYLGEYRDEHGRPPTLREIREALGMASVSTAAYHLKRLAEAGVLRRRAFTSRGIELLRPASKESVPIPVLGEVAAGAPIEVPESPPDPEEWGEVIEVDPAWLKGSAEGVYALRVRGHSMVDALIGDGDIVILRHRDTAEEGETVAVYFEGESSTTLKRFYREGEVVRLQPANPGMEPLYVPAERVRVQGGLVGVLRQVG